MKVILLFLSLIVLSLSIKIRIIDNNYAEIYLGEPQRKFTFLIDLISPYSFILNKYYSETKKKKITQSEIKQFSNVYGEFSGTWVKDRIFLTKDKNFNIEIKFLEIFTKKTNLKADGVLGLGYSPLYPESSIYYALSKMPTVLDIKNIMTYDKNNHIIIIGEYSESKPTYNKDSFKLHNKTITNTNTSIYSDHYYLTLSQIVINKNTKIPINEDVYLGLIPIIITPKNRSEWFNKEYLKDYKAKNGNNIVNKNEKGLLFTNVYFNKSGNGVDSSLYFGNNVYQYKFLYNKNNETKSTMRIGNIWENPLDCWYVGLESIGIERADFYYENNTVILYSKKKYSFIYILTIIVFLLTSSFFIYCVFTVLCSVKKKKKEKDENGQELKEL